MSKMSDGRNRVISLLLITLQITLLQTRVSLYYDIVEFVSVKSVTAKFAVTTIAMTGCLFGYVITLCNL